MSFFYINCFSNIRTLDNSNKDQLKEDLLAGGDKQTKAIQSIQTQKREDLIPLLPVILRSGDVSEDTVNAILSLYLSYDKKIELYQPNWQNDLEWILEHSRYDSNIIRVIKYAEIEKDRRFFFHVSERVTHRSSEVRAAVYSYLAHIKDDRCIPYLLELAYSKKPIFRYYYLEALRYMDPDDERFATNLGILLEDESHAIRSAAILAMERYKGKDRSGQLVLMATNDVNYEVRKYAVISIKNQNLKTRSYILKNTIQDKHPEVRDVTIDAINFFNIKHFAKNISDAMEVENKSYIRLKMINSLLYLGNHGGGKGLSVALRKDHSVEVRSKAAYAAGVLGAKNIIPDLTAALRQDKSEPVKIEVAKTLGVLKEKSTIPAVLDSLSDSKESVKLKLELVSTLDSINEPAVMPIIFDLIEAEPIDNLKVSLKSLLRRMLYRYYKPKFGTNA